MPASSIPWYVIHLLMNKGHSKDKPEENPPNSDDNCADVHRGKAIAATGAGIVTFTGLSFIGIAAAALIITFFGCVVYGIGIALSSL
jgi:hypothetical protein